MPSSNFPLDRKESLRSRNGSRYFLDPDLPEGRFDSIPQLLRSTSMTFLRRSLLFVMIGCGLIYFGSWGERWWQEKQHREWLSSTRAATVQDAFEAEPLPAALPPSRADATPTALMSLPSATLQARATTSALPSSQSSPWPSLSVGDPVGRLTIPSLGVDGFVEHGENEGILRRAIGHLPGTALPGEGDNVVVAAHRDSFFRGLRSVGEGDVVVFETPFGLYRYRVEGHRIVQPEDTEVLAPSNDEQLTLITCYPFDFVGAAPQRFVVTARRIDETAASS